MSLETNLTVDLPHLQVTLDLFDINISPLFALLFSAVRLSTVESWVLPEIPIAISMNRKLYPTTACVLMEYLCFCQ